MVAAGVWAGACTCEERRIVWEHAKLFWEHAKLSWKLAKPSWKLAEVSWDVAKLSRRLRSSLGSWRSLLWSL